MNLKRIATLSLAVMILSTCFPFAGEQLTKSDVFYSKDKNFTYAAKDTIEENGKHYQLKDIRYEMLKKPDAVAQTVQIKGLKDEKAPQTKTFTVNYALIALYVSRSFLSYDLGDRLGKLICDKDVWWDYSNEQIAEVSFRNVMDAIDIYLLPWFEERENKESLKEELLREEAIRKSYGGCLSDIQQAWLDVIDSEEDYSGIISSNIDNFKLPKKLH